METGLPPSQIKAMILGVPVWLGQWLMVPGFVLLALAGAYMAAWHWRRALRPVPIVVTSLP